MSRDEHFTSRSLFELAFQEHVPVSAWVEVLTRCNWACSHCYLPEHQNKGMTTETLSRIFGELRELGTLNLVLTGGELFLRDDALEIISMARKMGFRTYVFSNASLLTPALIRRLSELHIFRFSCTVFSIDEDIHDSITGVRGSLRQMLGNVFLMKQAGITVEIKTPAMTVNKRTLRETRKYFVDNGFPYLSTPSISVKTDGDESPTSLRLTDDDKRELLPFFEEDQPYTPSVKTPESLICSALRRMIAITSNGDVWPCSSYFRVVGNIYDDSLLDIWHDAEYVRVKNATFSELACTSCNLAAYCSPCPGIAESECGDIRACPSICRADALLVKEYLEGRKNRE